MNMFPALVCTALSTLLYMGSILNLPTTKETDENNQHEYEGMVLCMEDTKAQSEEKAQEEEVLPAIQYETITLKDSLSYENKKVVEYKVEYPKFSGDLGCLEKINQYYEEKANAYVKHVRTDLYESEIEQYQNELPQARPTFEAISTFKVTNTTEDILSLYTDSYEYTGGAHGNTTRDSQNWNLKNCKCLSLEEVFTGDPNYKNTILSTIEKDMSKDKEKYFQEDNLAENTFNPNNFYMTPKGIVIYYQEYDIAPYVAGIVEFKISTPVNQKDQKTG